MAGNDDGIMAGLSLRRIDILQNVAVNGRAFLLIAAREQVEVFKLLLAQEDEDPEYDGKALLHIAAVTGYVAMPLHTAAALEHDGAVDLLLALKSNWRLVSNRSQLQGAVSCGGVEVITRLLAQKDIETNETINIHPNSMKLTKPEEHNEMVDFFESARLQQQQM
ncbi:hypothetical protein MMC07_006114 [Pseudocyphellaria aurata]|nr:hypothetical protein [Pseudocyphellaria aurata]